MNTDERNAVTALLAGGLEATSTVLEYEDDAGRSGRCMVRVHEGENAVVIICTDIAANTGPSITNAAPAPWQYAEDDVSSDKGIIWLEHYGPESDGRDEHRFDRVEVGASNIVTWKHLVRKQISDAA